MAGEAPALQFQAYPSGTGALLDKLMRERSGGKLGITMLGYDDRDSENYTVAQVRNGSAAAASGDQSAFLRSRR